jgi:hypothetical protein
MWHVAGCQPLPHIHRHRANCARERARRSITAALSAPIQLEQMPDFSLERRRAQLDFLPKKNTDCHPDALSQTDRVDVAWQVGAFGYLQNGCIIENTFDVAECNHRSVLAIGARDRLAFN